MARKENQQLLLAGGVAASDALTGAPVAPGSSAVLVIVDEALTARKMVLSVTALSATVLAADDYGSVKLCDLPDKNMLLLAVELDLVATKGNASSGIEIGTDLDLAVGTAAASAQTLATTMIDVIEKSDHDSSTLTPVWQAHSGDQSTAAYPLQLADSATLALYLNIGLPVGVADDTLSFTGTVTLIYYDLGNVIS